MLSKLKKLKAVLNRIDFYYKTTISLKAEKLGNKSEGWWIFPDTLKNKQPIVFSFGLGEDISFDTAIMQKYNAKVYGFDPTPKSLKYIKSIETGKNFILQEYAVSNTDGQISFNLPANEHYVSGSIVDIKSNNTITVEVKRMRTILEELKVKAENIDILKMDIEGAEYSVIEDMLRCQIFPNQVLIEYHHFFDNITNEQTKENILLLLKNNYELFYIEAYNYSFIRKDLI